MATITSYWFDLWGYPGDLDIYLGNGTAAVVSFEPDGAEGYDCIHVAQGPIEFKPEDPCEA